MRHVPLTLEMRAGGAKIIIGKQSNLERVKAEFLELYANPERILLS